MPNKSFRDLVVWQKSVTLVCEVYALIRRLPKEEMFALASQMRRAAISIPSNIAEGQGRFSHKEFIHFLSISHGSASELITQLIICKQLNYLSEADIANSVQLLSEIQRMITGFIKALEKLTADC